jgi:hypothetical protein
MYRFTWIVLGVALLVCGLTPFARVAGADDEEFYAKVKVKGYYFPKSIGSPDGIRVGREGFELDFAICKVDAKVLKSLEEKEVVIEGFLAKKTDGKTVVIVVETIRRSEPKKP